MASSIPPSGLIAPPVSTGGLEATGTLAPEFFPPDHIQSGITLTPPMMSSSRSNEEKPEGLIVVGIMMFIMAIVLGANGAPGFMILFAFLFSFLLFFVYFIAKQRQADRYYQEQMEAQEAEDRLKEQIAQAVKESLRGNIKIRCRYCGSLNEDKAAKCESCGATL